MNKKKLRSLQKNILPMIEKFLLANKATLVTVVVTITDQLKTVSRIANDNKVNAPAKSLVTATRVMLLGNECFHATHPIYGPKAVRPIFNPASPYNDPLSENWAISKAFYAEKLTMVLIGL